MAQVFDRVKVATATTGTGNLTLGAAESGYRTFAQAGAADGATVNYIIEDGTNWEIGTGQLGGGGSILSRNVVSSSNGNAAISLSGNARVFSGLTKADIDGKSNVGHQHSVADVVGLQAALDGKQPAGNYVTSGGFTWENLGGKPSTFAPSAHRHSWSDIDGVPSAFTPAAHGHSIADVAGLQAALDGKQPAGSYAAAVHAHNSLSVPDTRNVAINPQDVNQALQLDFKTIAAAGDPPVNSGHASYAHVMTFSGWYGGGYGEGGQTTQLSFGDGLAIRQSTGLTTWGPWRTVWHDGNLPNPLRMGEGGRPFSYDNYGGAAYIQGDAFGWSVGYKIKDGAGVNRGGFGALGGGSTLTYYWIGADYDSPSALKVYPNGDVTAGGAVTAGPGGFLQATFTRDARNPVWRFGNAEAWGISYFQGAAGLGGWDTVGFHFGNPTADASVLSVSQSGIVRVKGSLFVTDGQSQPILPYRLYRRDDAGTTYSVQHHWTGTHWWLRGYAADDFHAEVRVGYADEAAKLTGLAEPSPSGGMRVTSPYGYLDIGPMNQSYCHFQTDRGQFYFNKTVHIDGPAIRYQRGAFLHHADPTLSSGQIFVSDTQPSGMAPGDLWLKPL